MRGLSKRLVGVIIALVVVIFVAFAFTTTASTSCFHPPPGVDPSGCQTEYVNEPLGWRFGGSLVLIYEVVIGTALVVAILGLLIAGGWMFQRFMERRDGPPRGTSRRIK